MANVNANAPAVSRETSKTYTSALAIVTFLFFFWGFVTVLNDILVPHLKSIFELNYFRVMLIQFAFFSAYFIFSIPSAKVVDAIGYKRTMVVGLLTMGLGALLFIPAASVPSYPLFLAALMVLAAGITALQVAANPYVAVLGPSRTASSRLNLTQAFNSLGTTIGPYLGGLLILGSVAENKDAIQRMSAEALRAFRLHQAASVKVPYLIIGLALIAFAVIIGRFKLPAIPEAERHGESALGTSAWKYRHLVLGCVGIFVYVGAEVSIGSFLINYFNQSDIGNLPEVVAAKFVACYWGGAMVGRFIGSAILNGLRRVYTALLLVLAGVLLTLSHLATGMGETGSQSFLGKGLSAAASLLILTRPIITASVIIFALLLAVSLVKGGSVVIKTGHLLGLCAISTVALVSISMLTTGQVAVWSIILVGLFNSIMFPSIFTLGIAELGPLTGDGSGLLIMAIVGGAIIPVMQGALADRIGIHHAFILPVICYVYIVYYAFIGSRPAKPAAQVTG